MNVRVFVATILRVLDPLVALLVFPAAIVMKFVRLAGVQRLPLSRALLRKVGIFPVRNHYYEPQFIFDSESFTSNMSSARDLPGILWNQEGQLSLLGHFNFSGELDDKFSGFLQNPNFGPGDGEFLYQMVRHFKPKRIVEIGSGYSTRIACAANEKNMLESSGNCCKHTCIEPFEMPWLESLGVNVIRQPVENVDFSVFDELQAGDILFIDSSHMIRPSGDVLHEYLRILPRINSGVIVHIHDIFSPFDYPHEWMVNELRFWNEQYLLEAFLTQNEQWKIVAALNFLHKFHAAEFSRVCPFSTSDRNPGSFYMQKC